MSTMDLVVPDSLDVVRGLSSETLYKLEVAGQIATEVLDERVVQWTEEGQTQAWIAEELGCQQPAVSKRQARLGVEPTSPRGRPRQENNSDGIILDGGLGEVLEPAEVLDPEPPVGHLPDFVADDADHNARTVSLRWFQWGRDLKVLLDDGERIGAKSKDDKRAIKEQADLMIQIARAVKGACNV